MLFNNKECFSLQKQLYKRLNIPISKVKCVEIFHQITTNGINAAVSIIPFVTLAVLDGLSSVVLCVVGGAYFALHFPSADVIWKSFACLYAKNQHKAPFLEMFETMEITIVLQSTRQIITAQAYEDFKTTIRRSYDATGVQKLVIYYISRY